MEGRWKIKVN
jgi:hypothetical protein